MAGQKKASGKKAASSNNKGKEKSQAELISAVAEKTGLPKTKTKEFLDAHAELLIGELKKNGSVHLIGLGKLKLGTRAARKGRNPATGQEITIKASKTVKLASSKQLKEQFN
jgi:DNA-binding protein HU-beta